MPGFGGLQKFFGNTASSAAGSAAGGAVARTLHPILQEVTNEAWTEHPIVPPDAYALAEGVAQGQVDPEQAATWAAQTGIGQEQFDALVNIANGGPDLGLAYRAWRRGQLSDAQFQTALKRTGLETQWFAALEALKTELLDPADIARGIHKSLIPDPGLLAVGQPTGTGNVPAYPVYDIDALAEAMASGYDKERLGVLVGLQGNPMGAHEAAQAFFRGVLEQVDYDRAIAEGNTRNEWGAAIMEQSRQIPSSVNYVEARVRGWIDDAGMNAGTARHGMTEDDTHLLFLVHGSPLTHTQVFLAKLRGGVYDGPTDDIDPDFLTSLKQSNMRPEWYNLAWHARFHYPPFFQTVTAFNKGVITAEIATQWLTFQGYDPAAIAAVIKPAVPGGTKQKALTAAQIRSAVSSKQITPADALTRLEALGYSAADAEIVLNNPGPTPPAA